MSIPLIIAEKPDQGAKLAAPFPHKKRKGYIEIAPNQTFPQGAYLTWAVGHLCELVPPEEYDAKWKRWSLNTLPILPESFQYKVKRDKWNQFKMIKDLLKRSEITEVIMAGDAEREGEAIIRIILKQCHNRKPTKRLWISSLTEKAVINGFQNLLNEQDTRSIYFEAMSRACADWMIGMNASRVYTLLLQGKGIRDVFSTGRVQTPTLALIVKREKEIEDFKSEPFWEVKAVFQIDNNRYEGKWHHEQETRIMEQRKAIAIAQFCEGKRARIEDIEKERKEFQPPFLFNLSSLQATANKLFKYSPKKTLDIAQRLYVKGIISYPRSDSSFVTKEEALAFPEILNKINKIEQYQDYFPLPVPSILNNKRFVNEKKVTDHYAIIPTEQVTNPLSLDKDEQQIYDLIIRRLIAAHYEKSIFDYTTIHTIVDERAKFISKGKQMIQEGWRKIIHYSEEKKEADEQALPILEKDETGIVKKITIKDGKTQPPKRYTEGQLITLMKTAGKFIEDAEMQSILRKTEGLGTEATRAGIITVLKDRKYIEVTKNLVYPTKKGILLIDSIGESILSSPEMTAKWEQRLHEIGEGKASPNVFLEQAKKLSVKLINDAKTAESNWKFTSELLEELSHLTVKNKGKERSKTKLGKCKKCEGSIIEKGNFYGCTNYQKTNCDFTVSKKILGKTISQKNISKLLKDGKTDLIKGFKKGEKTFDGFLEWNPEKQSIQFLAKSYSNEIL
ncbi:DNA topoisomerase III [Heyndrickxia sp. NPDC080065]|uniref:DNA topoisomerase III n=1 Tax=Heyndrickxia sp. NPDC080065 TaxID=3390568 RepID=UPI003D04BC5E